MEDLIRERAEGASEEVDDEKEGEKSGEDGARPKNTRAATEEDGLLQEFEFEKVVSAYGSSEWDGFRYKDRADGLGGNEPGWTSFTP